MHKGYLRLKTESKKAFTIWGSRILFFSAGPVYCPTYKISTLEEFLEMTLIIHCVALWPFKPFQLSKTWLSNGVFSAFFRRVYY